VRTLAGAKLAGPETLKEFIKRIDSTDLARFRVRVASQVDLIKIQVGVQRHWGIVSEGGYDKALYGAAGVGVVLV